MPRHQSLTPGVFQDRERIRSRFFCAAIAITLSLTFITSCSSSPVTTPEAPDSSEIQGDPLQPGEPLEILETPPLVPKTRISPLDGMVMVEIPAGEFYMGKEHDLESGDGPRHRVYLDTYWIDQTDVTNAMYAKCVQAGKCTFTIQHSKSEIHFNNPAYANHPVVFITWDQAVTYCQWVGRRLPSEAEWEKAARGTDGRTFPWGRKPADSTLANFNDAIGDTTPVGSFPQGASPYSLLDMAGNVRQWVADWYDILFYRNSPFQNPLGPGIGEKRVLRGGSFKDPPNGIRVTTRFAHVPNSPGVNRGFRCATTP
jgi:formylglycine-generating enzyme required for sulfatase activity